MQEKRRAVRTPFKSRIRIKHDSLGSVETITRDVSDTGVFLHLEGKFDLGLGDVIEAQVLGLPGGDAPVLELEVMRLDEDGVGLKFK